MAIIVGIYTAVLALAWWQESTGSGHSENDLGSDSCFGCGRD